MGHNCLSIFVCKASPDKGPHVDRSHRREMSEVSAQVRGDRGRSHMNSPNVTSHAENSQRSHHVVLFNFGEVQIQNIYKFRETFNSDSKCCHSHRYVVEEIVFLEDTLLNVPLKNRDYDEFWNFDIGCVCVHLNRLHRSYI